MNKREAAARLRVIAGEIRETVDNADPNPPLSMLDEWADGLAEIAVAIDPEES